MTAQIRDTLISFIYILHLGKYSDSETGGGGRRQVRETPTGGRRGGAGREGGTRALRPAEPAFLLLLGFFSHTIQGRTGFLNPLRSDPNGTRSSHGPSLRTGPPARARPADPRGARVSRSRTPPAPRGRRRGASAVPPAGPPRAPEGRRAVRTSMSAASLLSTGAMAAPAVRSRLGAASP